jgi:transposase InsO family protein
MCNVLQIARSTLYYEAKEPAKEDDITEAIVDIFLKEQGLVSSYTVAQYKPYKAAVNEETATNSLNREFDQTEAKRFVVSDLTYVNVHNRWHYICVLIDLFNREIVGYSAGPHKDAALISRAFSSVQGELRQIQWFHTDRGSEFKNQKMDELLKTFEIGRSLSMKGCPYDNAVAEATYKIMKTEFVNQMNFQSLRHLELELYDYVNWFNKHRIHGTLGYMTPVQYRHAALKKVV